MTAKEILQLAGWPTDYIVLDFETYYDKEYSLTTMSPWEYIADERFEDLGLGIHDSHLTISHQYVERPYIEAYLRGVDFDKLVVVVQNAQFDALILKLKYRIEPKYIIDIKHLAAHYDSRASHRLKDLAVRFGLQAKGNTADFIGLHYRDMIDEQRIAIAEYCVNDVDLETKLFEILLSKLTNPIVELAIANHTTQMYLTPRMSFDFELANQLMDEMIGLVHDVCNKVGMTPEEVSGDLSFTAALKTALAAIGESVPVKPHKRPGKKMTALLGQPGVGPALAKTDEACQELEVHSDGRVRDLMAARKAVNSWPGHIKRIEKMMALTKAAGGRLPAPLNYYGAHTGRWSGGGKINLQNLGAKGRTGSGNHPLLGKMREMICTGKGTSFLIVDSAQIEARVLAWLAGQADLVQGFADDRDVYSEFATKLFQAKVRKPQVNDPPPISKLFSLRRGFGKDTILGCGYGMGGLKFYQNCRANPDLRPLFDSGQYDFGFVNRLIKLYRYTYPAIPKFWQTIEKMFRIVTQFPNEQYQYSTSGLPVSAALLTLWNDRGTVNTQLPSGRVLYYPHAAVSKASNRLKYHHGDLWGGTLCLAGYTPTLTKRGWVPLKDVLRSDMVWDGVRWVNHGGVIYKGEKGVIGVNGIDLTPDHRILTTRGWKNAGSAQGFTWAEVWVPDCYRANRIEWKELAVEGAMQLRQGVHHTRQGFDAEAGVEALRRVCEAEGPQAQDTRYDEAPGVCSLEKYGRQMPPTLAPSMEELRQARNPGVCAVAEIQELLGRHGASLREGADARPDKQRGALHTRELQVGNIQATSPQSAAANVYDLLDCGPLSRFTVADERGSPRLVHNCENVVQAIARDLLAYWILECEKAGLAVVLHVHDEIVAMSSDYFAEDNLEVMLSIVESGPSWAAGIPLAAEGCVSKIYKK